MPEEPKPEDPAPFELQWQRIGFCILVVYVSVASNYLSLDRQQVHLLIRHPTAQIVLIYVLGLVALRQPGQHWLSSVVGAGIVTGVFWLIAYVI